MKTMFEAPATKRLGKLKYDKLLSRFGLNFIVRLYTTAFSFLMKPEHSFLSSWVGSGRCRSLRHRRAF